MPNGSGEGGATEALADHLGSLIDNLANFRNKVDLPRREGLLGALQNLIDLPIHKVPYTGSSP
jgi:hypothetical protein